MEETPAEIRRHIEVLSGFEVRYAAFIKAVETILEMIPSQLAALADEAGSGGGETGRTDDPDPKNQLWRRGWVNHPLTITVVGTVVGGVILAAILGLLH